MVKIKHHMVKIKKIKKNPGINFGVENNALNQEKIAKHVKNDIENNL
jgi:uncharacterized alpha/beta hydrolase family protein